MGKNITENGKTYPTEAEQHIRGCGQAIYSSVGTIAGEEDVTGLLWEEQNTNTGRDDNERKTWGPWDDEDPEELIILDQLMTELERTIENSITNAWTHIENGNQLD